MNDPYLRDTPGLSDPANNLILLTPNDNADIPVGIKSLRVFNPNATAASVSVITTLGETVTFKVPAQSAIREIIRITRLLTSTTAGVEVHGFTDYAP